MTRLTHIIRSTLLAGLALATAVPAAQAADDDLDRRIAAATEVLQDLNRIPEQAIPSYLLNRAYAVAVIPNVIKGAFIVGGSFGKGLLVVRQPDGAWSNPSFIQLSNIGIGWQIGGQGSDLILVFKSRQSIDNIARGKFTLGGSASASAGPVGRTAVAATDGEFKAEIYTYARSRGLFAGVSLDGGAITIDREANTAWYGKGNSAAAKILDDPALQAPPATRQFIDTLAKMAPPLQWQSPDGSRSAQSPAPAQIPAAEPAPDTKTYAIDEGTQPAPETVF